jgi:hypothetical protein
MVLTYDSEDGAGPIQYASSAYIVRPTLQVHFAQGGMRGLTIWTCILSLSASEYIATVLIPNFFAVLIIRYAISPLINQSPDLLVLRCTMVVLQRDTTYRFAINIFRKWGFPSTTSSNPRVTGKVEESILILVTEADADAVVVCSRAV